jgi:hypothetical protein
MLWLGGLMTMLSACPVLAAPEPTVQKRPQIEVPIVGRPGNFSEAVGRKFEVSMRVSRTELHVGQSLTLTVRVAAIGPWSQPPERPPLGELPKFKERFKIDRTANRKPDRVLADQRAWEFDYRLRPLSDSVERIPPLAFVWYRPNRDPNLRGFFPTTFADEIDLKVKPVTLPPTAVKQVPIEAPEGIFQIATGPAVLAQQQAFAAPGFTLVVLLLLTPPTAAGVWYVLWRRWYPDAARRAQIRQSRAAKEALRALGSLAAGGDGARVERISTIATQYLRHRFDLPPVEPTPAEVTRCLQHAGASPVLADKAAAFFRACDAIRFAPALPADGDLAAAAQHLIVTLEAEPWSRLF